MAAPLRLGGTLAGLNVPPGFRTTTIKSKTNIFRGCRSVRTAGILHPQPGIAGQCCDPERAESSVAEWGKGCGWSFRHGAKISTRAGSPFRPARNGPYRYLRARVANRVRSCRRVGIPYPPDECKGKR